MTHVDSRQRASTSVAAVVAASYQAGNNHMLYVSVNVQWRTLTCILIVHWITAVTVSRPVLNQTVVTVWFSTAPGASRLSQQRGLWRVGKRTHGGGRAVSLCIHPGSNDMPFRWLSQLGGIVRGSFQEIAPRKTAKNNVRFDGSQPPRWRWKFGGHNNTTIFDNIDIGDLLTPIHRCSSRLRFSMSDVYIGRTLSMDDITEDAHDDGLSGVTSSVCWLSCCSNSCSSVCAVYQAVTNRSDNIGW